MLSVPHLIIIFLVALVVFGPEKLPELARNFGKVMAEFRRATGDLKSTFEDHMRELEREAEEHRIGGDSAQPSAPFTVTGGSNAGAPDHVVAATPLSARLGRSADAAGDADTLSDETVNEGEPPPSIGETGRKHLTESILDPAASLAPAGGAPAQAAEVETKSEIVTDGHRSS